MAVKNILYAQSGGATAVINASAAGVIEQARQYPDLLGKVLAAKNGILGVLQNQLYDTSVENPRAIEALKETPGAAFGSCRYKMHSGPGETEEYHRIIEVFKQHQVGCFLYNGGNDSADTCLKIARMAEQLNYPLQAIHIAKTIDNDLPETDSCPGFGSAAKYVAISTAEASQDLASMFATSTKVFIMEVMGRHAGWLAASAGLIRNRKNDPPHIILFPERPFNANTFLQRVKETVEAEGYCVVVASEGVRDEEGHFLSEANREDAFGHKQLGGLAPVLSELIGHRLGYKQHWAVLDYLQRAARHIASLTDLEQAYAVGSTAVDYLAQGMNAVMPAIRRLSDSPYSWELYPAPLSRIANVEKKLPEAFISADGFSITQAAKDYLAPLIEGEAWPTFSRGLPVYSKLKLQLA